MSCICTLKLSRPVSKRVETGFLPGDLYFQDITQGTYNVSGSKFRFCNDPYQFDYDETHCHLKYNLQNLSTQLNNIRKSVVPHRKKDPFVLRWDGRNNVSLFYPSRTVLSSRQWEFTKTLPKPFVRLGSYILEMKQRVEFNRIEKTGKNECFLSSLPGVSFSSRYNFTSVKLQLGKRW